MATTIKLSKETKKKLLEVKSRLEEELGRRLSFDEAIRILIEKSRPKEPGLLLRLAGMEVPGSIAEKARILLEGEADAEEEAYRRRYSIRYKRHS